MTLMEEKTLADHDINVRSIRQELQLLEEQLKPQPSSTVTDEDTVSRKAAIKAIRDTYRVSYPIDMISKDDAADVLTELPSVTPTIQPDPDTVSRPQGHWIEDGYYGLPCVCSYCGHEGQKEWKYCPFCGDKKGGAV